MAQSITYWPKPADGFRTNRDPSRLLKQSGTALDSAFRAYAAIVPRQRMPALGHFEFTRFKTTDRLEYVSPTETRLRFNRLLPSGWSIAIKNRNYKDRIMLVWFYRKEVLIPARALDRSDALLSVLHEFGHIYTAHLTESRYVKCYDRAWDYHYDHRFPGFNHHHQQRIRMSELMYGDFYPSTKAIRLMPTVYRKLVLDVLRVKQADEQFAWAWALRTKIRLHQAGHPVARRHGSRNVRSYIRKKLGTHEYMATQVSDRKP